MYGGWDHPNKGWRPEDGGRPAKDFEPKTRKSFFSFLKGFGR